MKKLLVNNFENESAFKELTQLEESEERFRNTFEQAAVGIAHVGTKGNFIRINQTFCDIVGYSQQEMLKLTFQEITHPDDLAPDLHQVQKLLDLDIDNYKIEKRYFRKNKTLVWINLTVSLVQNETGDPKYFIAVIEDITERKQAEDKFELLVKQAGDAFFVLDYDGAIIDVNHQACVSLGYSHLELVKMKISQVDVEIVEKQHEKLFWDILDSGQYITIEGIHQRKDGSTFPVEVRLGRLDLRDRKQLLALARDITERKKKDEKLKKNSEFQNLISGISNKFVGLTGSEFEKVILKSLARIGRYFDVDTVRLYRLSPKGDVLKIRNMWHSEELAPPEEMPGIHKLKYPNLASHYSKGESVLFSKFDDSPKWPEMRKILKFFGTKAGVGVPLESDATGVDVFAMDKVRSEFNWPEDIIEHSKTIGEIFLNALKRREAEVELQNSYHEIKQLKNRLEQENIYLREDIKLKQNFDTIIGQSTSLNYVLHRLEQVAPTDATVLIGGETGTGKELFAHAIHRASRRKNKPMINVGCASLSSNLIESEFFGHEKGAYTGADKKRIGRFELANGGTIFLDEIGELSLELQAKLLRVLQEGEFERLGSSETIKVNVRVITATNRSLEEEVTQGRFREDLYYRLNTFKLSVPPLRDRSDDIPLLVRFFLDKLVKKHGKRIKSIPKSSMRKLENYSWPGNIRELQNVIENAVIISENEVLKVEIPGSSILSKKGKMKLKDIERDHIIEVLKSTNWRLGGKAGAAELLGMKRTTLYAKMKKFGIRREL